MNVRAASLITGCVALLAAGAPGARAATVTDADHCTRYGCEPQPHVAAGADDHLDLTVTDDGGAALIHDDAGALADQSEHCAAVDAATVRCDGFLVLVDGGPGADRVMASGAAIPLHVAGHGGDDVLTGAFGGLLDGGPGDDDLAAGAHPAELRGGPGDDRLAGGPDDDLLRPGPGDDAVDGGAGHDGVSFADDGAVRIDLARQSVAHLHDGDRDVLAGVEDVTGGPGDDVLLGDSGENALDGGPGRDRLDGRAGDDHLRGGPGSDVLIGGAGDDGFDAGRFVHDRGWDRLACGSGADRVQQRDHVELSSDCERLGDGDGLWRLIRRGHGAGARAELAVFRGDPGDFVSTWQITAARPAATRPYRTVTGRATDEARRRSRFFRLALARGRSVIRVRAAHAIDGHVAVEHTVLRVTVG